MTKTAIITGGRRGIGLGIALAMRDAGYRVVVVAKSWDRGAVPSNIHYQQCDLADPKQRVGLLEALDDSEYHHTSVLVNNAGINAFHNASDFPLADWAKVLEVNLTAVFDLCCQAKRVAGKRIINIASVNAFQGARRCVAYVAAKHGLLGMTKCLSNEWAPDGVTVNNVAPGFVLTDMLESLSSDTKHREEIRGRIPAGVFGEPKDVGAAVVFLASDAARYITGSTITVDGGWCGR